MAKNGNAIASIAATDDKEWEDMKKQITEMLQVFGSLLFLPFILLVAVAFGIRAGVIACAEKTLQMVKAWEK